MEGPPDWDLLAVVRSCSSTTTTTTATTTALPEDPPSAPPQQPPLLPPPPPQNQLCFPPTPASTCTSSSVLFGFSSPLSTTSFLSSGGYNDLQDICKPLINSSSSLTSPISSSSSSLLSSSLSQFRHVVKPSQVVFGGSHNSGTTTTSNSTTSHSQRAKKRKNLMKKVCHVPAEGLSSDMWAWRKYGQKPIKGSPYPRGYYRCSSSKGCSARKQVERNRTDPKMFIVTYTSEHNHPMPTHRNSLAGSTRQKTTTTPSEHPPCSSPSATTTTNTLSPLTEPSELKAEGDDMTKDIDEYDDDDMRELSDLMLNDDFYVGFEQIDGGSDDSDCFSEQFSPSSSEFPWLSNGGSTATAAGGS